MSESPNLPITVLVEQPLAMPDLQICSGNSLLFVITIIRFIGGYDDL